MREEFHARVAASGLSASAYIKRAIFAGSIPRTRRPAIDKADIGALLAGTARIADQLGRVERLAAGTGQDVRAAVENATAQLDEIRTALFKALGRTT
ncbi:hypothetical protein SAMN05421720_1218 [Rhodospira trueperi]|uniref:Uncharacterized protein n=2 Tax=Rhodospira trueperi TaxID=69960 RepID=A0A1G7HHU7_9PROT|nr:hypothetical protein SAMN05421720_1218 [Rhodospira trueperi]